MSQVRVRERPVAPAVREDAHTGNLPQGTLALMAQATAEQHRAVLELQSLFARRGGIVSQHQLTIEHPEVVVKELTFPSLDVSLADGVRAEDSARSFAVINFSPITIQVGWGGRAATAGGASPVPGQSYLQMPTDCNNAEVSAASVDLEGLGGAGALFLFIRYRHLVNLDAGPLSNAQGGREGVFAVTASSPRSVAVTGASSQVIAANANRKGLEIINTSETAVSLGLGAAAVAGDDIYLQPGGSWSGTISGVLWRGAVTAIGEGGKLAVVEV